MSQTHRPYPQHFTVPIQLLFTHDAVHQDGFLDKFISYVVGSKKYEKKRIGNQLLHKFKHRLQNGFSLIVDIAIYFPDERFITQNLGSVYRNKLGAICALNSVYNESTLSKEKAIRGFKMEIDRYFREDFQNFFILALESEQNRTQAEYNLPDFNLAFDKAGLVPYHISLFNDKSPSPTLFLLIDLLYSTFETLANRRLDTNKVNESKEIDLEYNENFLIESETVLGVFDVVQQNHNNSNYNNFEDNFFLVFRNKYLLQVIMKNVSIIHQELGYHYTEIRKYYQLSLYFLIHNNYQSLLIQMLKYDKVLNTELFCQKSFIKIFFKSQNIDLITLYINRFKDHLTNYSKKIINVICGKGSIEFLKEILLLFPKEVIGVNALLNAGLADNKLMVKFILEEYMFFEKSVHGANQIRNAQELLFKKLGSRQSVKKIIKKYCDTRSFLSKIFK